MARCGCATECLCSIQGSDCIEVVGDGSLSSPFTVSVIIDSTAGSPSAENPVNVDLLCTSAGLVAEARIYSEDTACIAMEGEGVSGDPMNASPIISPDAGNVFECRPNGMYAPAAGVGAATNFALFEDNASTPTILPANGGGNSYISVEFDTLLSSAGINAYVSGAGPDYTHAYVEVTAAGYYYIAACVQGWGIGPTYAADANLGVTIKKQPGIGGPEVRVFQSWAQMATTDDAAGNTPMISLSGIAELAVGDKLWTMFSFFDAGYNAFPGATLNTNYPTSAWFHVYRIGV